MSAITQDKQGRKNAPMARGLLDYFPAALAGVAECSRLANEQHNPGEEMHWARDKSSDHADCIIRHLIERDAVDEDGIPHIAKVAWRALAAAQEYYEAQGATPGRASKWTASEEAQVSVQEASDDWIPWTDGENPEGFSVVEIKTRNGKVQRDCASAWRWSKLYPYRHDYDWDIVEYRVIDGEG